MVLRRKVMWVVLAVFGLIALAILLIWSQRKPLARKIIDDALKEKGVQGSFTIRDIDQRHQRIEHLVIGDQLRPDLVADWVELDSRLSLSGFAVKTIRASGVRVNGRLVGGKLTFGELDKLLPKPSGEPFKFPALDVDIRDGRLSLVTPWGGLGAVLTGTGNLAEDFAGMINVAAPTLSASPCVVRGMMASGRLTIKARRPGFVGPVQVDRADCAATHARQAKFELDVSLNEAFDEWQGRSGINLAGLSANGSSLANGSGLIEFSGTRNQTSLRADLATGSAASSAGASAKRTAILGNFDLGQNVSGAFEASGNGNIRVTGLRPQSGLIARALAPARAAKSSPFGGIVASLSGAISGLETGSDMHARFGVSHSSGRGKIVLSEISGVSASGAKLTVSGESPISFAWPGGLNLEGEALLTGGGFPATQLRLTGASGIAVVAPITANGTQLSLTPITFALGPSWQFETVATINGALGAAQVGGLTVPVSLAAGATPLAGCTPIRFEAVRLNTLTLAPGAINFCLRGNQAHVDGLSLAGTLGGSPLKVSAQKAVIALGDADFGLDQLNVQIGSGAEKSAFEIAHLNGSMSGNSAAGYYAGIAARIGSVPLRITEAKGDWRFANGSLASSGGFLLADAAAEARFQPMGVTGLKLGIADGRITAQGVVNHTQTGTPIANVRLVHNLSGGIGEANIDMPGVTFGQQVQPEELTRVTLGVIANVEGTLKGNARINWSPSGVTSTGRFGTDGVDLAAAFGPVRRLQGFVEFTDLLGLVSAPSQTVKISEINPGIAVTQGEVRFQLLPNLRTQIEGGRWPFSGGELLLDPTLLDLTQQAERHLTFRVSGVDAARFIQQLEFENISATGRFDGVLPMIFDNSGGRIVGGRIVAQTGGTLAYVGDISNEKLGAMGRFAFDALKSIRYERLSIDLDGALDGDVVTRVSFKGVNQAPIGGVRAKLPIPIKVTGLTGIPFIFNVRITAPFRQLFELTRSFDDPSRLIQRFQPRLRPVNPAQPPVQPPASDPVR